MTKQSRHEFYKELMDAWESDTLSLSMGLVKFIHGNAGYTNIDYLELFGFPELHMVFQDAVYCPEEDQRMIMLLFCIEMTK